MFANVLTTAGRRSYWIGLSPGKQRHTSVWIRREPVHNVLTRRSWLLHWWMHSPHPMFLYRSCGFRFLGIEVELEVKAQPFPWEGRNFFVIDRFEPSARLHDALQLLVPDVTVDAGGYIYLFDTTYQSEVVRFKEPDYMLSTFRSVRNDRRMKSYLAAYQPALVEINDPDVLDQLTVRPMLHVSVSMREGKVRGALATPAAAAHWQKGMKPNG